MTPIDHLPVPERLRIMREVAASKVIQANGSPEFFREIEANVEAIALASVAKMAPVNVNLLGLAMMLMAEVKRRNSSA